MIEKVRNSLAEVVGEKDQYGLEDVLRAIDKVHEEHPAYATTIATDGKMLNRAGEWEGQWHLGKPLEEQSEETIAFIGKVLGV